MKKILNVYFVRWNQKGGWTIQFNGSACSILNKTYTFIIYESSFSVDNVFAAIQAKKGKTDQRFHPPCDISDFYDMADLRKEPILFTPEKETEQASPPPKVHVLSILLH